MAMNRRDLRRACEAKATFRPSVSPLRSESRCAESGLFSEVAGEGGSHKTEFCYLGRMPEAAGTEKETAWVWETVGGDGTPA